MVSLLKGHVVKLLDLKKPYAIYYNSMTYTIFLIVLTYNVNIFYISTNFKKCIFQVIHQMHKLSKIIIIETFIKKINRDL